MLEPTTDVTQADGFIRYSRGVALSRLGLVACFVALLAAFTPPPLALLGALEFGLYFALFLATEFATRQPDRMKAFERLRWQSDVLMVLLVSNACWIAVQIRLYDQAIMQVEAALLAICVLLFAALRVHMSRISYAVGVAPPALTLLWVAIDWSQPLAANHYGLAMLLFVAAVLLVTSRQQVTDKALTRALADLTRKNQALVQAVDEAKAAGRAKTRLLAVASHEIRTPLNAVMGFAQALRREPLTPSQAELLGGVLEGGAHLTQLLDVILEQVRSDDGGPARPDAPPAVDRRPSAIPATSAGQRRLRILAAEDNPANRRVLSALVDAATADLVFAEDGAQALEAWRAGPFDLVLMDVNMPVMDGLEALGEIRRTEAAGMRIPVWMVTANAFDEDVARYLAAGADGVLRKPIDVAALLKVLSDIAGGP